MRSAIFLGFTSLFLCTPLSANEPTKLFREQVAPIFEKHCVSCHNGRDRKGKLSLETAKAALTGGESGKVIQPGNAEGSLLLDFISGDEPEMPKDAKPLSKDEIAAIRRWIATGAKWPTDLKLADKNLADTDWWSLRPIAKPPPPKLTDQDQQKVRTPIDAFIISKLREQGLSLSPPADRRTLIRRLTFDLHGLPPTPGQIKTFVNNPDPRAYEKLVDRLLKSPRYGERWARHWLDVVHYGDTHGYDKDKRRPNAWPYRDWVIRALNDDKPYDHFVRQQLAGDVLKPQSADGVVATGFIAAGPWDFVGHVELREGTTDKHITRLLDRDDMVSNTMSTFTSVTIHCARCHKHKFDPFTQRDYYSLQAVFAGVERADRPYQPDPALVKNRRVLEEKQKQLSAQLANVKKEIARRAGPQLAASEKRIAKLEKANRGPEKPEFGYHSNIEKKQNVAKWVQLDLGRPTDIEHIVYVGCHDTFNNIGAGFGFPLRYKIEISDDPKFTGDVTTVADHTLADVTNPGVRPQSVAVGQTARYVRFTATRLAPRQNDYIFALAELAVLTADKKNVASTAKVTSLDSIEAPVRWGKKNLVDGYYYRTSRFDHLAELANLYQQRQAILARALDDELRKRRDSARQALKENAAQLSKMKTTRLVYAAASDFPRQGSFTPAPGGKPRPIHLLHRGSVKSPGELMSPGALSCISRLESKFQIDNPDDEGQRRIALARWITDPKNPLTWRSIVNRVWHYHFGRGIVDTPNDFGRMGTLPTHPKLLDWLAADFRDGEKSLKRLHKMIVTSAVYRQTSADHPRHAKIDGGNRFLWRMNRRRLEAEALRDAVLQVSGKLDTTMYGPGFDLFGYEYDHSPRYLYQQHDVDDPKSLRRTVYRTIVRSVPDPFMESLDCADPSLNVPVRNTTLTALQALALLNNPFMVRQSEHFALRVNKMAAHLPAKIDAAYSLALGRKPNNEERNLLIAYAKKHGLSNTCRLIFNTNEFIFVD